MAVPVRRTFHVHRNVKENRLKNFFKISLRILTMKKILMFKEYGIFRFISSCGVTYKQEKFCRLIGLSDIYVKC